MKKKNPAGCRTDPPHHNAESCNEVLYWAKVLTLVASYSRLIYYELQYMLQPQDNSDFCMNNALRADLNYIIAETSSWDTHYLHYLPGKRYKIGDNEATMWHSILCQKNCPQGTVYQLSNTLYCA